MSKELSRTRLENIPRVVDYARYVAGMTGYKFNITLLTCGGFMLHYKCL